MDTIKKFWADETGLELSEYAIAAALIVIALIAAFKGLAGAIGNAITSVANTISSNSGS
jgi:Flp pilus assembly pilin Flp